MSIHIKLKKVLNNIGTKLTYGWILFTTHSVWAKLPTVEPGGQSAYSDSSSSARGNLIKVAEGYLAQGGKVLALSISVLGFIWVSYSALAKFNECRTGKAEWAELGMLVVAAAAILVFITLLLTQTESIMNEDFATMKTQPGKVSFWGRVFNFGNDE